MFGGWSGVLISLHNTESRSSWPSHSSPSFLATCIPSAEAREKASSPANISDHAYMATSSSTMEDSPAIKQQPNQVPHCPNKWPKCGQWLALCKKNKKQQDSSEKFPDQDIIIYVLGGPGSGKGTQCSKIVEHFGFTHLSAGELLETEVQSGSQTGKMIQEYKKEGKLVPSEIVVKLLQQAMQRSGNRKFLIDGFPRNEENRMAAEKMMRIQPTVVLVLECSEEETIKRILHRNQGRVDDNIDTIRKRLKVYKESTLPVIDHFTRKGKVRKIDAERPVEEIFKSVEVIFSELGLEKLKEGKAYAQMT